MISKTFEWYRIVSATPNPTAVEARTKAATELTAALPKQDPHTLLALAQGIAREFDGSLPEVGTIEWLLRTLKQHDPAISEDLSENQMELRCIAAITFGELLFRSREVPQREATMASAIFMSAMNIRPLPKQRYLRAMLEELSKLALNVIETAADIRRAPADIVEMQDSDLTVSDFPAAKKALSQVQNQITGLNRNAAMDREEISLFWFISAGFSRTKRKLFSSLPVNLAAVHAALEVSHFLLTPAPLNCFEILAAIIEKHRKPNSLKSVPFQDHLEHWTSEEWNAIAGEGSPDADLASKFPGIFPIGWIANRMREGQALPSWPEFQKMTLLKEDAQIGVTQFARQLLCEKIGTSLAGEILE